MLIILEGVDGGGKSTLADRILEHLDGVQNLRLHSGPLTGDPLKEYEWRLRDYVPGSGQHIVCDRWHVGEMVYGPLYRKVCKLTSAMQRHVEMFLDKLGAHKLIVTTSYIVISQRLQTRGEDFLQNRHLGLVWDWYNDYGFRNDWGFVSSDEIMEYIIPLARRKEHEVEPLRPFTSYVGPPHPRHLLLGVTAETHWARPHFDQCFVPYPNTAGEFLINALEYASIRDYGLANAEDEDVAALWQVLGRPNVICLGPDSEKASRAVPHLTVTHPSEARRQSDADPKRYGLEIRGQL